MDTNTSRSAEHAGPSLPAEGLFRSILEPGERVLFTVQPRPFRSMRSKAAHALFGMVALVTMTLTPVHGLISAAVRFPAAAGPSPHPVLWIVLCIACYSMLVPFAAYRKALRTWYALTDRRVLRSIRGKLDSQADLEEIESVSLHGVEADGTGDILFCRVLAERKSVLPRFLAGMSGVPGAAAMCRSISEAMQEQVKSRQQGVHDYLEFLLQGKRPEDLSHH